MKANRMANIKEFCWIVLKKITNSFSNLTIQDLGHGYIKCLWQIGNLDHLKIKASKSCFYAIRLFDITNNRNTDQATCIMKEIQVSQFQSSLSFPIPINKGVYYFEFGYRKKNGHWRLLATNYINLGFRIQKIVNTFRNDNWFSEKTNQYVNVIDPHEEAYQLSLPDKIGGSENF
tara:strand:- start:1952 stop:2476 length:525 start_codon:yes stop_codon:yes gene_type:complete